MGRMGFKLSHVMPHAWFYKLKEVGKTRHRGPAYKATSSESNAATSTPPTARKVPYTSPINHKAIDIPFPVETPKRSSLPETPALAFADALDQFDEYRPSIVLPSTFNIRRIGDNTLDISVEDDHQLPSVPINKARTVSSGVTFDVRELERRLKALGSEDRRKYYASPLLSVALPSPRIHDGMAATASVIADAHSDTLNNIHECSLDCGVNQQNVVREEDGWPHLDGCASRSIDESHRQSTSSSDTGFERGSSSMWERDVFSITSDGSECFTMAPNDVIESHSTMQKSSWQRLQKLRERSTTAVDSPSLHGSRHIDHGRSRFYDFHQKSGHVKNDTIHGSFYKDHRQNEGSNPLYLHNPDVRVVHREIGHAHNDMVRNFYKDQVDVNARNDVVGNAPYVCDGSRYNADWIEDDGYIHDGDVCDVGINRYKSNDRSLLMSSPSNSVLNQDRSGTMLDSRNRVALRQGKQPVFMDDGEGSPVPSMECYSSDNQPSERRRRSCGDFSYTRCKERLLPNDASTRETELEKMSNYTKFKLRKKGFMHSKMDWGVYSHPGLCNVSSNQKYREFDVESAASANVMTSSVALDVDLAQTRCTRRPRSSADHQSQSPYIEKGFKQVRSPYHDKGLLEQMDKRQHEQGPSWFKGTLRAVQEKMKDPSFQQFSSGVPVCSRVFDSFALAKCSYDPKQDFKESMVEMIMGKDLHSSHDMVELLQCYLTLNAEVYHDTIVKVFTEVWSEMFRHV